MAIDIKEVEYVADLARLHLSDEEKQKMAKELSKILDFVGKINELDTEGVEPTAHVLDIKNVMRDDEPVESDAALKIIDIAPESSGNMIVVPSVIE